MHKRFVINIVSRVVLISCACMLAPLAWAFYDDPFSQETKAFIWSILLGTAIASAFLWVFRLKKESFKKINAKDCLAIVGLSWIFLSLFGALPFYFSGVTPHFCDAFFEITSGFTTTGSSIFTNVEILPRGILFWRSLANWLGGMGIIVLYISIFPALGIHAFQLYEAEASGPTTERLAPQLKETAQKLWGTYVFLSVLQVVFLLAGGMPVFDSLCHTFGTIATGGFSTKNASIGAYSPYIQWVVIVFMFLGATNFVLVYQAFRGKARNVWRDEEFRWYAGGIGILILFFTIILWYSGQSMSPFRDAAFQVVSIASTTGFATADYNAWPFILQFILFTLMFTGSCGGSTAGGMKLIRVLVAWKTLGRYVLQAVFPNAVLPVRVNGKALEDKLVLGVLSFLASYIFLFLIGGVLLLVTNEGCDLVTVMSAAITCLSNVGPGLNDVGPMVNFGWVSTAGKWVLSFLMLAGRLELYALLILFVPATWKK